MHPRLTVCVAMAGLAFSCDRTSVISFTGQLDAPEDLLVTADSIYFSKSATSTSLNTLPINGGQLTELVTGLSPFVRGSVTKDDSALYWFSLTSDGGTPAGTIFTASLDGSGVRALADVHDQYGAASDSASGGHLYAVGGRLYWAARQQLWSLDIHGSAPTSLYEYTPTPDAGSATRFGIVSADERGLYFFDDAQLKFMSLLGGPATVAVPSVPIAGFGGITVTPTQAYWSSNLLAGGIVRAPLLGSDSTETVYQQDGIALHAITEVASEGETVCFLTTDIQLNTNAVQCLKGDKAVGLAQGSGRRFYGLQVRQGFVWFFDTVTGSTTAALFKIDLKGTEAGQ